MYRSADLFERQEDAFHRFRLHVVIIQDEIERAGIGLPAAGRTEWRSPCPSGRHVVDRRMRGLTIARMSRRTITSVEPLDGGEMSVRISAMSTLPFSIAFRRAREIGDFTVLKLIRGAPRVPATKAVMNFSPIDLSGASRSSDRRAGRRSRTPAGRS